MQDELCETSQEQDCACVVSTQRSDGEIKDLT